jgi:hypothetical protein
LKLNVPPRPHASPHSLSLQWSAADDSGTCRAKLEQALSERQSLLLVNKKLIGEQQQQRQRDEQSAAYAAKLERCIAALCLKCDIPNPFPPASAHH